MKNVVFVTVLIMAFGVSLSIIACDSAKNTKGHKHKSLSEPFKCQLKAKKNQACSAVQSLESGEISFDQSKQSFVLNARYRSCFQFDEVVVRGEYTIHPFVSVFDVELLAKEVVAKDGSIDDSPRTIGIVTLSHSSLQGRFVDVWAVIRKHTQMNEKMPSITATCKGNFEMPDTVK